MFRDWRRLLNSFTRSLDFSVVRLNDTQPLPHVGSAPASFERPDVRGRVGHGSLRNGRTPIRSIRRC
jgi:hypothetical protein